MTTRYRHLIRAAGLALLPFLLASPLLAGNIVACPVSDSAVATGLPTAADRGGLVLYPSLAEFEQAVGDQLPLEDFEGGAVSEPGDGIGGCEEPVGAASDDQCFSTGDLIAGFGLTSTSGGGYVVLGDNHPQVGQEGLAVGPMEIITQEFSNISTIVTFIDDDVTAVAMDVIPGCNGLNVVVQIYDRQDSLLGSTTISVDASWHSGFLGLTSPQPIGRIELRTNPSGGQLIQNLRFGPDPDLIFRDRFEP